MILTLDMLENQSTTPMTRMIA